MNITGGEQKTKIRVHEYAKKVDKPSKEIIQQLSKLNVEVTNHMSTLKDNDVSKLDGIYKKSSTASAPNDSAIPQNQEQSRPQGQNRPQGKDSRQASQSQSRPQGGQGTSPSGQGQSRPSGQGQNRPAQSSS